MKLAIYCGSSEGRDPGHVERTAAVGRALAQRGIGIVYGGGRVGLMGTLADAALAEGGTVIGVIPKALEAREVAHRGLTELHVVADMHERKALMAELSDGFIALPGGIGTLEELFESWTWGLLGFHRKPCALLNAAGYYDELCRFIDKMVDEGFLQPHFRDMLVISSELEILLKAFETYQPPVRKGG
ncbi:LOG family protein [Mangrovitalea sediminis]|uniref:LOG family protein n=1 Tax=Mangrovitalea sediminis TaxID=1982043 RepID=UPI000BE57F8C|nr:TIGR00730 family Rossman fold protein [Mangrovitalea sediminis]